MGKVEIAKGEMLHRRYDRVNTVVCLSGTMNCSLRMSHRVCHG